MLVTLGLGSYTAVIEAVPGQAIGTALVEVYEVPN